MVVVFFFFFVCLRIGEGEVGCFTVDEGERGGEARDSGHATHTKREVFFFFFCAFFPFSWGQPAGKIAFCETLASCWFCSHL